MRQKQMDTRWEQSKQGRDWRNAPRVGSAMLLLLAVSVFLSNALTPMVSAQSGRRTRPTAAPAATPAATVPRAEPTPEPAPTTPVGRSRRPIGEPAATSGSQQEPIDGASPDDNNTIKIDTTLVTIPVTVLDRAGRYLPFLTKEDFFLFEDGVEQEIAEFTPVTVPLHVVLLIDTSRSTVFRLEDIQEAAIAFVNQLRPDDRVMVVSFDSKVHVDSEFTSDRNQLRRAIQRTRTGGGTKLYEAVDLVVAERLNRIEGRKAIVLFTDGVDTESHGVSARDTVETVEEGDVIVYPIQYDTRTDNQSTIGGTGFPPISIPWPSPRGGGRRRFPLTFPLVSPSYPQNPGAFPQGFPQILHNQATQWPQWPMPGGRRGGGSDAEYQIATQYLEQLATRSGGRVQRATTLGNVQSAFAQIADELRHQYALSYYPTNTAEDGTYRQIKVQTRVPNTAVRARQGYRAKGTPNAVSQTGSPAKDRPVLRRQPIAQMNRDAN